jgi:ABC-type microcin C transport system permease subunit YejB
MRCALVLFSLAGFLSLFPITGFKSAGFDRCAIVMVRQQTWQESNNSY